jgi:hypothetical protein
MTESTALTVAARASVALKSFATEAHLIALAASTKDIGAPTNRAGRDQCHRAAMEALKARTAIAATGKAAREDATAFSKAVIAEEKRLSALIEPEECRLKYLRDAYDEEQERIKREAEEAEQKRLAAIKAELDAIRDYPVRASAASIEQTESLLAELAEEVVDARFGEFAAAAVTAIAESGARLREMLSAKRWEKKEADRIAEERAEAAAKAKAEQEAAAAALAAERAEFARIKAESDAQRKAEREKEAAEMAEKMRAIEQQQAHLAAERAKIEAANAAEEARIAACRKAAEAEEAKRLEAIAKADRIAAEAEAARRAATSAIRQRIDAALDRLSDDSLLSVAEFAENMAISLS